MYDDFPYIHSNIGNVHARGGRYVYTIEHAVL